MGRGTDAGEGKRLALELSQLLSEEGMVSPDDLLRALARQREAGGTLDTALLELGLLPENRLVAAMGRAADLPVAPLSAYERIDARARRVFPSKVAERHGLAPFALDGRELSLVATNPVDLGLLDEVSFMLSLHLAPHVGPEWRVRTLIQRLYGGPLPPRLARLGEQSARRGTSPGVVAAPLHAVAAEGPSRAAEPEPLAAREGIYLGSAMPAVHASAPQPDGHEPTRPPPGFAGFSRDRGEPLEPLSAALSEALEAFDVEWSEPEPAPPEEAAPPIEVAVPAPAPAAPPAPGPVDASSLDRSAPPRWTLEQAREVLAGARTRDEVVVTTLRYARDFFQFTALFAVTRDAVAGHDGLGPEGDARDLVRTVAIYADDPGMFRTAIESMAPYLGRADRAAAGNLAVLDALGRGTPRTMLVTPILLRRRPVCLLYGDNGSAPVSARRLGDLLLFCSTIGSAFERIIKARKGDQPSPAAPDASLVEPFLEEGAVSPPEEPIVTLEAPAAVEARPLEPPAGFFRHAEPAWRGPGPLNAPVSTSEAHFIAAGGSLEPDQLFAPSEETPPETAAAFAEPAAAPPVVSPEPVVEVWPVESPPEQPPEPPVDALVEPAPLEAEAAELTGDPSYLVGAYMTSVPGTPAHAELLQQLVSQAVATAPILCDLLPGPIEVAPEELAGAPAGAQGPVFEALVAIGQPAVPPLLSVLTAPEGQRRRAAVVLLGAIGDPATLASLADRCLDSDASVAEAAREALAAHQGTAAMRPIPERLRRALASGLGTRAAAAARALSALRDVESIPNLIQALEGTDPPTAEAASAALAAITLQRHGAAARKWLLWWKENRGRGRAEWLFSGLTAEDREVRAAAAAELERIASPPVSYSPDQASEEREQAARAWASWFTRSGYRL